MWYVNSGSKKVRVRRHATKGGKCCLAEENGDLEAAVEESSPLTCLLHAGTSISRDGLDWYI
jgi:hypothetical protein